MAQVFTLPLLTGQITTGVLLKTRRELEENTRRDTKESISSAESFLRLIIIFSFLICPNLKLVYTHYTYWSTFDDNLVRSSW